MSFIRLFLFLSIGLLVSCKANKVVSFNNPDLINKSYSTFKVLSKPSDTLNNNNLSAILDSSVVAQMTQKGFTQVNQNSDLLVRYKIFSSNTFQISQNRNQNFNSLNGSNLVFLDERKITESILLIDLHDRKKKKLVWQGSLDLNYSTYRKKKVTELIPEIVAIIFETLKTP